MPSGVVSVGVMADFLELIEQADQAGVSIEAFSGKVVTSTRQASRAWADYAKSAKLSSDEAARGAEKVAATADAAFGSLSRSAKAAGDAAMMAARATGASADQQTAAYAKASNAVREWETTQKTANDAAQAAAAKTAAATKAMADAQAEAAAKVDLLSGKLSGLGEHATGVAREISKIGGIGFAASIAGMGDLAAKYQQATQQIAANSDISSAAAARIGKAFLGTSGTSIYSAKELTESFASVAGQLKSTEGQALNSAQALKVMSAAGDLAEATSSNLTDSTAALSTVMQGYHLPVSEAAQASDLLFNTSRALNQPLATVAQAINRLHGRLGSLAPSLGDVGGLMVALGSHGVQGSRGVSVVNTAFQTLVGDSQPVQEMLTALGVKVFNAQGKFVGMQNVIAQLQPKMGQLTQQNQDLAAKTLFGSSAAQVMLSIIQRGPQAFNQSVTAAQKLGTTHQAASDQSKTLGKQLDILKATVENDATSIGLKLIPELTNMAKGLESGINWLDQHKTAAEALAIVIGTVLGGAVAVFAYQRAASFVTGVSDMTSGVATLTKKLFGSEGLEAAAKATAPEVALVGTDAELATAKIEAFGGASATATGEVTGLDTAASGLVGTLGKLGTLSVAFGAFEALKQTPGIGNVFGNGNGTTNAFPLPKTGETERAWLAQNAGLPGGYHGPLTVGDVVKAREQQGYPAGKSLVEQLFKQMATQGHFGHHGFVPGAGADVRTVTATSKLYGGATGLLTSNQQQFAAQLSGDTGMNPNMVAAWLLAEQNGSAAKYYQSENNNDWLNIGVTGPAAANFYKTNSPQSWTNPISGANATAAWLKGQTTLGGYGHAAPSIVSALQQMQGASPAEQVRLLQGSGWASGGYPELASVYNEVIHAGGAKIWTGHSGNGGVYTTIPSSGIGNTGTGSNSGGSGGSLNAAIQRIGSGGKMPSALLYEAEKSRATQLADQATRAQAVGQAQVTLLQAINQQLQDKGAAIVQKLSDQQALRNDAGSAAAMKQMMAMLFGSGGNADINAAMRVALPGGKSPGTAARMGLASLTYTDVHGITANASTSTLQGMQSAIGKMPAGAAEVQALKDLQQIIDDRSAAQVTAMKDQQTITDQASAIQVQAIKNQTQVIQDVSAIQVATIQGMATKIADAANAAATLIGDNAQTNADTISERGLYGLNLVVQKLQVQEDQNKASWDAQIAAAQQSLDNDQMAADVANAQAQLATDQVTATEGQKVLVAQQNLNLVTLKENALEAKAQQHLDAVTAKEDLLEAKAQAHLDTVTLTEDSKANSAKAHLDAVTVSQDARILKATQHADAVQLSVDVTKIGPAQTAVDMNANASKTVQTEMQDQLKLATAQGDVQINAAQLALANVTANANETIAGAQNSYQAVENAANTAIQTAQDQSATAQDVANKAIQGATDQYNTAQDTANQLIQAATDNYQSQQDAANQAIAIAQQTQATTAATWAQQLANDQAALSGLQGQAATSEAAGQGAVTGEQALASTQFAGSGLVINQYGVDLTNPASVSDAASWAIRSSGLATV